MYNQLTTAIHAENQTYKPSTPHTNHHTTHTTTQTRTFSGNVASYMPNDFFTLHVSPGGTVQLAKNGVACHSGTTTASSGPYTFWVLLTSNMGLQSPKPHVRSFRWIDTPSTLPAYAPVADPAVGGNMEWDTITASQSFTSSTHISKSWYHGNTYTGMHRATWGIPRRPRGDGLQLSAECGVPC